MRTFIDVVQERARLTPEKKAFTFLIDGEEPGPTITFAALYDRARAIAVDLLRVAAPGDRAILLYPPGIEYIEAFLGCLLAGVIAVPVYPPTPSRMRQTAPRLNGIFRNATPSVVLTPSIFRGYMEAMIPLIGAGDAVRWLHSDETEARLSARWRYPEDLDANSVALLQYTSGSTGDPKGVMVTHGNLLSNTAMMKGGDRWGDNEVCCHWLPTYHDLGLMGCTLGSLRYGGETYFMSPLDFLQRPLRWLKAISRFRGTVGFAPNFAYDLCTRRLRDAGKVELDLSSWKIAGNGAEPIVMETMNKFVEAFAPHGFRRTTFSPCYGLAEATLLVSWANGGGPVGFLFDRNELARNRAVETTIADANAAHLVASGTVTAPGTVTVVDPVTLIPCGPDEVGEIWIRGDYVAAGYWRNDLEDGSTFHARTADGSGPFLRSGDLGILRGEQLIVTGRIKDLIIQRGVNHYPQDLERTAQDVLGVRRGGVVAFSIGGGYGVEERVVLVAELDRRARNVPPAEERRKPPESYAPLLSISVPPMPVPATLVPPTLQSGPSATTVPPSSSNAAALPPSATPPTPRFSMPISAESRAIGTLVGSRIPPAMGTSIAPPGSGASLPPAEMDALAMRLLEEIREALSTLHGIVVHDVCVVVPDTIPKTPSGKVQRRALRDLYLSNSFPKLAAIQPSVGAAAKKEDAS